MDVISLPNNDSMKHSLWNFVFNDLADPRTSSWFLVDNPVPLVAILISYLYFVLKCGPNFMKDRKAYSLKKPIMIYNLFQVIFNTYLFYKGAEIWGGYNWICQPIDYSNSPVALAVSRLGSPCNVKNCCSCSNSRNFELTFSDRLDLLCILYKQNNRLDGYHFLYSEEEKQPSHFLASLPSHSYANHFLDIGEIYPRRTNNICRIFEHFRSHYPLWVLLPIGLWTRSAKVLGLEKIHYQTPIGPIYSSFHPQLPDPICRLRFSQMDLNYYATQCHLFLLPV